MPQRGFVMDTTWHIRPYQHRDRQAVRHICAATCWMGEYRPGLAPDDWIWAEYWTRYFTDQEPQHTWVVEAATDGRVGGYLTGTCDVGRARAYLPRLLPGIVWHVIRRRLLRRPVSRRAIAAMLRAMLLDGEDLPAHVAKRYPATWHFDLLPEARQSGMGGHLYRRFIGSMRRLGVPGVHGQVLSLNRGVQDFLARMGFAMVHSTPTRACEHVTADRVEIQTWARDLAARES